MIDLEERNGQPVVACGHMMADRAGLAGEFAGGRHLDIDRPDHLAVDPEGHRNRL